MQKSIKVGDIAPLAMKGRAFLVGEFRGYRPETINYKERATGAAKSFDQDVFLIETVEPFSQIQVRRGIPPGGKPDGSGLEKGQQVLVYIDEMERDKGNVIVRCGADGLVVVAK